MTDQPETPKPDEMMSVTGYVTELADGRSVYLAKIDDGPGWFVKFTNGDRETKLKLTDEAMKALVALYLDFDRSPIGWQLVVDMSERIRANAAEAKP